MLNTEFNLGSIEFTVNGETFRLENLSTKVTDLDLTDYLKVIKEIPAIMREIKGIVEDDDNHSNSAYMDAIFANLENRLSNTEDDLSDMQTNIQHLTNEIKDTLNNLNQRLDNSLKEQFEKSL